jgi:TonB family protein
VDTKPVRLHAPAPQYTEAARANRTQGSVILRVLVNEDGNVTAVRIVRGLPDGLTEQAIDAARRSKFKPAMKDGKAVTYWAVLEMTFNIR